jgi:uncharacterized protein
MWRIWQPIFRWQNLCPVVFADPVGLVVVMPRAGQPVRPLEVLLAADYHPIASGEFKAEDCGYIGSRMVTVDYGLGEPEMVSQYRDRYRRHARNGPAQVMRPCVSELLPAAEALHSWSESKPFVRRTWIYGSRTNGTAKPESDLDVAIEISPVGNDEDAHTSWVSEAARWRAELQPLLPDHALHLQWYDESNREVWSGANEGIQIYQREE